MTSLSVVPQPCKGSSSDFFSEFSRSAIQETIITGLTPMSSQQAISGLLTKAALCERLRLSPRTIENMVRDGRFPPPVRLGKFVYWGEALIAKWQQALLAEQESWLDNHSIVPKARLH